MGFFDYKPATAFPSINAALSNGWEPWNVDSAGTQWLRRHEAPQGDSGYPDILAVPQTAEDTIEAGEDTEDVEDSDNTFEELRAELEHEAALSYERALKRYHRLLESRAQGIDIPADLGNEVLAACGKSMADWNFDLEEVRRLDEEIAALTCGEGDE